MLALFSAPALAAAGNGAGGLTVGLPESSLGTCLKLSWTSPQASSAGAFRVYRSAEGNNFSMVHQGEVDLPSGGPLSYVDTGLEHATTYYYKVETVGRDGSSLGMTGVAQGKTPAGTSGGAIAGKQIIISISQQKAYFLEDGVLVKSHLVCTGTTSHPTPLGTFKVEYHDPCAISVIYGGVYCYWWLGFAPDTGMHALPYDPKSGTWTSASCLGSRGSHGCVRQATADAKWAYDWAPNGTRIDVIDPPFYYTPPPPPPPPITGGHASQGISKLSKTWFLAEGCTSGNFDEYVLIMNPNNVAANIIGQFMKPDGSVVAANYQVAPFARYTINVDNIPGLEATEVSTLLQSDQDVSAERAMYFDYGGRLGGSCSAGVPVPAAQWFFAEGYTGGQFDEFILLQNPGATQANTHVTFMRADGLNVTRDYVVKAHARQSIHVDDIAELKDAEVSTKVASDAPIVAERSQYFNYNGKDDGNASCGITEPKTAWFLAEGYTGGQFDTYVLLQNPNPQATTASVTFMRSDGQNFLYKYRLEANSRFTIHVNTIKEVSSNEVSTAITADEPIIAERSMYFNYNGKVGGSDAPAVSEAGKQWYLAEGYTGGQYDTYVLVQNPGATNTTVHFNYMLPGGKLVAKDYMVPAHSRFTVHLNDVDGVKNTDVSTAISADDPVICERAMYFSIKRL